MLKIAALMQCSQQFCMAQSPVPLALSNWDTTKSTWHTGGQKAAEMFQTITVHGTSLSAGSSYTLTIFGPMLIDLSSMPGKKPTSPPADVLEDAEDNRLLMYVIL